MAEFTRPEKSQGIKSPTEQDAVRILHATLGKNVESIQRFPTGLANYVYDVKTTDGKNIVVRLGRIDLKHYIEGAFCWYEPLVNVGVPLPKLYYATPDETVHGFPVMIMDRLPGRDLGEVYPSLTKDQKEKLAHQIVGIQQNVATLPQGLGFGYARSKDDPSLCQNWIDVINANLERSRRRFEKTGVVGPDIVDKVRQAINSHETYFNTVKPTPFLDDTTTKNVVINENGELSGIVDVDSLAFGDPLLTVALTRMSLLSSGFETDYIDYWTEELNITPEQRKVLDIYTAVFCLDFMSEMGQSFNKDKALPIDPKKRDEYLVILDTLFSRNK